MKNLGIFFFGILLVTPTFASAAPKAYQTKNDKCNDSIKAAVWNYAVQKHLISEWAATHDGGGTMETLPSGHLQVTISDSDYNYCKFDVVPNSICGVNDTDISELECGGTNGRSPKAY